MDKDARKELGYNNREWGQKAEALAAEYFLKEGYTIRERNWRAGRKQPQLRAADTYLRTQQVLYEYRFDIVTFIGTEKDYVFAHYEDAYLPEVNSSRL